MGLKRSWHKLKRFTDAGELWGQGPFEEVDAPGEYPALLAIHGFGATPNEVYLLTELAQKLGLRTRAPLLPGHGTRPEDLAPLRYSDWYAAAEREFLALAEQGPVIVGGQSMGAVIALDLAAQFSPRVAGVIALGSATRLTSPYPNLALALAERAQLPDFSMPKFDGPNISAPEGKRSHRTYSAQPMRAAMSLRRAGLRVLGKLGHIQCPAFIAHGRNDQVCPVENAWEIADGLGSSDPEVLLLARSAHIVTKDADQQRLRQRLQSFLSRLAEPAQRPVEP